MNDPGNPDPVPDAGDAMPSLSMEEQTCRTCRFFVFAGTDRAQAPAGECHRYAPRVLLAPFAESDATSAPPARWPVVAWHLWCGEWVEGVSYEDMIRMARSIGEV
ncbi:MAG: hypothetical protein KDM91_03295 [Verrucomicrobiae bacterium]|nr:hypothetical protein [Verrucomicrobiae bacterium]MCB1234078.1 hypothetical protein [Verrucomicrobiae bacterium]MCP5541652.1 hypothetical protein [Akkermansiaceae bacterium]MCP5549297.1 hypothetical protein [Akkermansiaceae bacterium]